MILLLIVRGLGARKRFGYVKLVESEAARTLDLVAIVRQLVRQEKSIQTGGLRAYFHSF